MKNKDNKVKKKTNQKDGSNNKKGPNVTHDKEKRTGKTKTKRGICHLGGV